MFIILAHFTKSPRIYKILILISHPTIKVQKYVPFLVKWAYNNPQGKIKSNHFKRDEINSSDHNLLVRNIGKWYTE